MALLDAVSELRGPAYGELDHFVRLTMTDDGQVIANLLLDGVLERDLEQPSRRLHRVPRDPADPHCEARGAEADDEPRPMRAAIGEERRTLQMTTLLVFFGC